MYCINTDENNGRHHRRGSQNKGMLKTPGIYSSCQRIAGVLIRGSSGAGETMTKQVGDHSTGNRRTTTVTPAAKRGAALVFTVAL